MATLGISDRSPSRPGWAYDVFLSFRGEDTRKNFTDHLYTALVQAGIHTFRDNDELPRGEDISSRILKSIQESKISLVVFSKGYASSTWCLDELAKIMECKSTFGQIVLPIFYDIDPAHVLKQKGSFAEAFGTLEERFKEEIDKVNKWKGALVEAANLSGWDLHSVANGHESSFVQKIVEEVSSKLNHKFFNVAKHPVGVGSHVKDIIPLLGVGSDDVRIVGIYGMPGVEISLSILKERSLVTINGENKLQMHNLLRDMGREIIRQMSPKHPGKRSRLWSREDVLDVLIKITGTELVEGLVLDVQASEYVALSSESFARMRCLQLLQCNGVHISGCYERLPKELTWLCWHKCPLESLPPEFQLDNLVVLDMQHSLIRNVWEGLKFLNKLKIINLSHSVHLVKTPDFTGLSNLERLILEGCTSLVDVDHSIGHLESLVFLNLEGCRKLDNLPESICHLKSLETLNIIECSRIRMLPEHFGKLKNLRYLLFGSSIKEFLKDAPEVHHAFYKTAMDLCVFAGDTELFKLESSLSSQIREKIYSTATHSEETITKIQTLLPASFVGLSSMRRLDLRYRELSNINTSINFGSLSSLQDLNLAGNNFFTLPMGIGCLPKLEKLNLCCCRSLLWISELPPSLKTLEAYDCTLMKRISIRSKIVPDLLLGGCMNLVEIEGLENMVNKPVIYMEDCLNLSNKFKKTLLQVLLNCKLPDTVFPGSAIPYWFSHRRESPLTFCLPPISSSEIQGLIVWAVYSNSRHKFIEEDFFLSATVRKKSNGTELLDLFSSATIREKSLDRFSSATIRIKSNGTELFYGSSYFPMFSDSLQDHSWVIYIPSGRISCATLEGGEEMEVSIRVGADAIVSKCGVHLVLNQPEVLDSQGSVLIMEIERQPWFLRNLPEEFSESSEAIY